MLQGVKDVKGYNLQVHQKRGTAKEVARGKRRSMVEEKRGAFGKKQRQTASDSIKEGLFPDLRSDYAGDRVCRAG